LKKFLIIRFSSIGDIVLTTPVIRCLRNKYPEAQIHYVTKSGYASILASNPNVDKVYSFEKEITDISSELKAEQYDFIIDLHRNLRSSRLKKILRKPSATFPKLNWKKFLLTNFKWNNMPDIHIVDRYFEAVKSLKVKNDNAGLDYFIPSEANVQLADYSIPSQFVVYAIGAQYTTKKLPNHKIIKLIHQLNAPVVLLGDNKDLENAKEIAKVCPSVINLCGELSLNESASVVQQANKIITHDSGLMHIASALKKPIISIWGNTIPELGMHPYIPDNRDLYTIHEVDTKCRPCSKIGFQKCPKKHFRCMENQNLTEISKEINK
jgi:ADP-heptose:LPS heptosyltransferase